MKITRPMKPAAIDEKYFDRLTYPLIATPKIDGIRCLKVNGRLLTASFKPIPNRFIDDTLGWMIPDGFDGELVLKGNRPFHEITSAVMSRDGEPNFEYHVFDYEYPKRSWPYSRRLENLKTWFKTRGVPKTKRAVRIRAIKGDTIANRVKLVEATTIRDIEELINYVNMSYDFGYEGAILRSPLGSYKCGRSTVKQQWMLKVKRFYDAEAVIVGFEEQQTNTNEAKRDELGRLKRSSAKVGKKGNGTLGALIVEDRSGLWKKRFRVGFGFNDLQRRAIWKSRAALRGQLITYRYQKSGSKDAPRHPGFVRMRHIFDIEVSNG